MEVVSGIEVIENMLKNRERFYEKGMKLSSYQTAKIIKSKVSFMKEPLLKKVLSGERITIEEDVRLDTISDVEFMIEEYLNGMSD